MKIVIRMVFGIALFVTMLLPFSAAPAEVANPDDDCMPKFPPPPVLKMKVRVPACSEAGNLIQYRICIENCSSAEAHHVLVKNAIPSNAKYVKADPLPLKQGDELHWQLGTIGGGATREIVLTLKPTNLEDVKNCPRVQFEHGQCVVTRQAGYQGAPGMPLDQERKPPKVTPVPDIKAPSELTLAIRGPSDQYANLPSKYEITVTNKAKVRATKVLVSATVPKQLKVAKVSEPGIIDNEVAWFLGNLEPGQSRVLEMTLRASDKGEFCFKVSAEADAGAKVEKEFCTKFMGVSAMSIEMYDTVDPVFIGQKTSYPVIIKNVGSAPVTNVRLWAFVPDALKLERANAKYNLMAPVKGGQWIEFPVLPKIDVGLQSRATKSSSKRSSPAGRASRSR